MQRVEREIKAPTGVTLVLVIDAAYDTAIGALRAFAGRETKELKSPIMRFLQIEEWSRKNVQREQRFATEEKITADE